MSTLAIWAGVKIGANGAKVNSDNVGLTTRISQGVFTFVLDHALDTTEIEVQLAPSYIFGSSIQPKLVSTYALDPADFRTVEVRFFDLSGNPADTDFDAIVHRFEPTS